jgi:hypothetical protein
MRVTLREVVGTPGMYESVRRLLDRALPQLEKVWDGHGLLFEQAFRGAETVLAACARADAEIFTWSCAFPIVRGKVCVEGTVHRATPEVVELRADGAPRRAYRAGCGMSVEGVRWASIPADFFGGGCGVGEEALPVFVQGHALRQLHERLDLPGMRPWSEYHMVQSLLNPVRVDVRGGRERGSVMLEYRIQDRKAGYLIVTRIGSRVLVRTFLFLTMAGTPEGDRLARRLRLTRDEAAWLGLHRLSSLAASDVRDDAELCAMLDECGCGQLVEIGRGAPYIPVASGFAGELRKYLRMAPAAAAAEGATADDAEGDVRMREAA